MSDRWWVEQWPLSQWPLSQWRLERRDRVRGALTSGRCGSREGRLGKLSYEGRFDGRQRGFRAKHLARPLDDGSLSDKLVVVVLLFFRSGERIGLAVELGLNHQVDLVLDVLLGRVRRTALPVTLCLGATGLPSVAMHPVGSLARLADPGFRPGPGSGRCAVRGEDAARRSRGDGGGGERVAVGEGVGRVERSTGRC